MKLVPARVCGADALRRACESCSHDDGLVQNGTTVVSVAGQPFDAGREYMLATTRWDVRCTPPLVAYVGRPAAAATCVRDSQGVLAAAWHACRPAARSHLKANPSAMGERGEDPHVITLLRQQLESLGV